VVLVVPRQIRRSPAISWRPSPTHYKKSSYSSNNFHRPPYYGSALASRYYSKKPFRPLPYPHGGDDFDQGHEAVNHVHIPYGKDVSHGISFGKGYIPYENIKTSSLPYMHERYMNFLNFYSYCFSLYNFALQGTHNKAHLSSSPFSLRTLPSNFYETVLCTVLVYIIEKFRRD